MENKRRTRQVRIKIYCEECFSNGRGRLLWVSAESSALLWQVFGAASCNVLNQFLDKNICEGCIARFARTVAVPKVECCWCGGGFVNPHGDNVTAYFTDKRWEFVYTCDDCVADLDNEYIRALSVESGARRRAEQLSAMPPWADRDAIKAVYEQARILSRQTGIAHHVDHFYPLNSPLVCGLHVAANLRVIPAAENLKKSNKLPNGFNVPIARTRSINRQAFREAQTLQQAQTRLDGLRREREKRLRPRLVKSTPNRVG